ncbi:MAG: hypothetical protein IPM32_14250 [Ignavibacteriae bacterium]|nr:hypothetical protein [Ignavibacteriota bacterium]
MNKSICEKTVLERFNELGKKPIKISLNGKSYTISKFYNCFKLKDKNKKLVMRLSPNSTIEEIKTLIKGLLK